MRLSKEEEEMIDKAIAESIEERKKGNRKTYSLKEVREEVNKILNGEIEYIPDRF